MSDDVELVSDYGSDSLINFVQKQRVGLLVDEQDKEFKLAVLNSIATTAVQVKRITTDENNANADREVAIALANAVGGMTTNPFKGAGGSRPIAELPPIELVHDELSTTIADLSMEDLTTI